MSYPSPHLIEFGRIGESAIGYITVTESNQLPFVVQRMFWTYYTPESITRGRHAHHKTEQILIAVSGKIIVSTESANGEKQMFTLKSPEQGVYIPPNVWHTMEYSHNAVQLALASTPYNAFDYIRDKDEFFTRWKT
jgi:mannose-6-phosphate isomerase-like protein (cupin superfamily)